MAHETPSPRVFFYVQHLLGIGHLARASRIADALVEDHFEVTVVTGGSPVPGFPGTRVKHLELPAVLSGDAGFRGLVDEAGKPVDAAFEARRRDMLLGAFQGCDPNIVIIEAFPFGRRQVRFELLPLLAQMRAMERRPRVVTSLRDILQERTKPGRDEETVALVKEHFDRVLVHGDPAFARLEETFPLATEIADKITYTGLVAPSLAPPAGDTFDIVVSAGGGAVGMDLVRAARDAAQNLQHLRWCVITGPNLPQADFDILASQVPKNLRLFRFRRDFAGLLSGCRLSISQAGYNTVCDILQAGCRSLLIPFMAGGETEQSVRAERLERLGLAHVLPESDLTPSRLQVMVEKILARPPTVAPPLDLDGARRTAEILRSLLHETA
ncbi:glycosyl transferase [Rhizobiaceae bacterium n13]|uniref:Glycosyl transferase n=1 Tax=Ferirhizobium litorale TaxID=2927786 RepID=A0AAE3U0F6_9HYPH|nr:glycosyltransferase [Fererhizobium litorale]MDI7861659.1 glycosyl transferase [Fererhizobium litorale]MDI7921999.1 glycosyl transferase [Fererhizobium litorale]